MKTYSYHGHHEETCKKYIVKVDYEFKKKSHFM